LPTTTIPKFKNRRFVLIFIFVAGLLFTKIQHQLLKSTTYNEKQRTKQNFFCKKQLYHSINWNRVIVLVYINVWWWMMTLLFLVMQYLTLDEFV
jgi:predicted RND superfamily exporter protein